MITKNINIITHSLNFWLKGLLLTVLTAMPLGVVAEDFVVNGIIYEKVPESESQVQVKGLEASTYNGILEIPDEVTNNGMSYDVIGLLTNCFAGKTIYALSFKKTDYPDGYSLANAFSNCSIKYLDLTSNRLFFATKIALSNCTIERLVISAGNYDVDVLNSAKKITTLVCPDLTFVPTELTKVTTVIVPNAIASQTSDSKIKGFGDVSGHQAGKFFSFVAGENLLFQGGGNIEAYVPRESPWDGGTFYLTHKNKTEDFVAAKGTALFLKIKANSGNKIIIPSASSAGSGVSSSLIGSVTAATKTQSGKYYALKKDADGLFPYTGSFIPPGVAVVKSDQEPPSSQAARAIRMVVEGEPSAIESLQEHEATDTCYDLFGNPADAGQSGIRIINGKKVIRR